MALEGDQLTTDIASEGLAPNQPHAQHIHGLKQAISECPALANDQDGDGLVNTTEGQPSYGPILTSLTTEGDTSPESGLAVDRFPVANEDGILTYGRTFGVPGNEAERLGEFAIVQHGVDLNGNGVYDEEAAGSSDLDPSCPRKRRSRPTVAGSCRLAADLVPRATTTGSGPFGAPALFYALLPSEEVARIASSRQLGD